jgi:hypothetical protein
MAVARHRVGQAVRSVLLPRRSAGQLSLLVSVSLCSLTLLNSFCAAADTRLLDARAGTSLHCYGLILRQARICSRSRCDHGSAPGSQAPQLVVPLPAASARQALQLTLCAGHMRAVHSLSQKRATRHLEHVLSLRAAPQPTQHADTTSRLPARA